MVKTPEDGTIDMTWTPEKVAERALKVSGNEELIPRMLENFEASVKKYENHSHIAPEFNKKVEVNTCASDLASVTQYDAESDGFKLIAQKLLQSARESAKYDGDTKVVNRATELGNALARHFSEAEAARAFGGEVSTSDVESDGIDIEIDGKNAQIVTCFAKSQSTTADPAHQKMTDKKVANCSYYIVLHADIPNNCFGVGINNIENANSTDEITRPKGESNLTNTVARNNTDKWST